MSDAEDVFTTDEGGRRERPFLFPWNRRLRHLQGVSIRNLNITPPPSRSHGRTITDDEVPHTLTSPTKRLAQSEAKSLQHSRSFSDLTSPSREQIGTPKKATTSYEKIGAADRQAGRGKLRRRSTLHWVGASPMMRQQKLEDVAASRLADTWFSIHCDGISEPVYVSEIMDKSMNPSFRFFDLDTSSPETVRSSHLILKLWAKNDQMDDYVLLIDIELSLKSLQFIGKNLENFHHPLPENCVLFHLTDGIYTSFTDMPVEGHSHYLDFTGPAKSGQVETTSSYDALMRLANLDDCIQDALITRGQLEAQINRLLNQQKDSIKTMNQKVQAQEKAAAVERAVNSEKKHRRLLSKKREELLQSLELRRDVMASGLDAQLASHPRVDEVKKKIKEFGLDTEGGAEAHDGQIRRICEELTLIYPIEPIKNKPLHFSIRGIYLPNSAFDDTNRDEIAAALGFTSHVVYLLSMYLSIPLPYPILSNASTSFIEDPISVAIAQRRFPLHPTNVSYKFEYGVLLLNKDIEFLMNRSGLRMLDIRHTLPNLKYLMYVLTAGTGELPARKAGGVKGLIVGRATPSMSRRGSEESVLSAVGWSAVDSQLRSKVALMQAKGKEKMEADFHSSFSGSADVKALPYRNSSLKEAF